MIDALGSDKQAGRNWVHSGSNFLFQWDQFDHDREEMVTLMSRNVCISWTHSTPLLCWADQTWQKSIRQLSLSRESLATLVFWMRAGGDIGMKQTCSSISLTLAFFILMELHKFLLAKPNLIFGYLHGTIKCLLKLFMCWAFVADQKSQTQSNYSSTEMHLWTCPTHKKRKKNANNSTSIIAKPNHLPPTSHQAIKDFSKSVLSTVLIQ